MAATPLISVFSQCNLSATGIGNFDGTNYADWDLYSMQGGTTYGTFSQETNETHGGTHALKAEVIAENAWQMRAISKCNYALTNGSNYSISFWLKGEVDNKVKVVLQKNDGSISELATSTVTISSVEWKNYTVNLYSDGDYVQGKIKLTFQDIGTYYTDELSVTELTADSPKDVAPNDPNIRYSGVGDLILDANKAIFYRFTEEFATNDYNVTQPQWSLVSDDKRAAASSGITIEFKSSSNTIKAKFIENTTYTEGVTTLAFAIYRNGELYDYVTNNNDNIEFSILNPSGDLADWKITMPAFGQVDFLGLEIDQSTDLQPLNVDNRPVYVAIGNSITHGQGQTNLSTHRTYPFQVADSLNYHLYNWGVGGSKINEFVYDNFAGAGVVPDVVSILWGYNDVNCSPCTDTYITDGTMVFYENLVTNICTDFPEVQIVGILPTYTSTNFGSSIKNVTYLRTEQARVLDELVSSGTCKNVVYFDGTEVTDANSVADYTHLNDLGATQVADRIITELLNTGSGTNNYDTIVMRSEYEKVGDEIINLNDFNEGSSTYSITNGNSNNYYSIDVNTGILTIQNTINDVADIVHQDDLNIAIGNNLYNVTIVDGYDYFITNNPTYTVLEDYQATVEEAGNPYTPYNNTWGDGSAVNGVDYRMATLVHPDNPNKTIFIWDTPSKAADFGGASVWCYTSIIWGARYNLREDVEGFPIRVGDINALDMDFDFEQLYGTQDFKIAMNQFFTEENYIAPFNENDGDFFMVFDQNGTWVPPYDDYIKDTLIDGNEFVLLHDSTGTIQNNTPEGYQLRRAIIKNNDTYLKGSLDLATIYNEFTSRGFLDKDMYFPNIQIGIEVTEGWGAMRVNEWNMRLDTSDTPATNSSNWYVSDGLGNDNLTGNNGKSPTSPLKTIGYAIKDAWQPGDTIFVMNGTYRNPGYGSGALDNPAIVRLYASSNIQSSEDAWLVITNYPGHTPKLQFDGEGGIVVNSVSYMDISGLEIEGPNQSITKNEAEANRLLQDNKYSGRGISIWGNPYPHHIKLHDLKVHDCPNSGLRINNGDYLDISYNEVYNCTWWSSNAESAVVIAQSKDFDDEDIIKMRMTHNVVHDNRNYIAYYNPSYPPANDCYGNACQDYIIDGSGVYITRNNPDSPSQTSTDYTSGWFYFANNISYNNGINGLVVHKTDRAIVTNNLSFMNGTVGLNEGRQNAGGITVHTSDDVFMYNNISWVRYAEDFSYQIYGGSAYTASNNFGINGNSAFETGEYENLNPTQAAGLFVDTLNKDFHLANTSYAIDAGIDHANLPEFDIEGEPRVSLPDVGPYEFQSIITFIKEKATGVDGNPNPTSGLFYMNIEMDYRLYSVDGRLIEEGASNTINLSDYKTGVYILKTPNGITKIMKQ